MDVLEYASVRPDILKLGAVNPLDMDLILRFIKTHEEVLILEELDDILETQIKVAAYDRGLTSKILD
jgi:indolepyruvate ferredoxin oxidoreductase, alpha subunit